MARSPSQVSHCSYWAPRQNDAQNEKDDVKVRIENGILYISGERKFEKEEPVAPPAT